VLAFVLEREETPLPDVGEPVAPSGFRRPLLEAERLAGGIDRRRLRVLDQLAEVEKVLLIARPLGELGPRPFGDERVRRRR